MQNRLKSKVFWVTVLVAIASVLKAFGVYTIDEAAISHTVDVVFGLLVIFGIANNPTDAEKF